MNAPSPLLSAHAVCKNFGGLLALQDISLTIYPQEIFGLIGPNGAGKTTLFNVITGLYSASAGQVCFNGTQLLGLASHHIAERGLARTFQNIRLFGQMTVIENVMVARHVRTHSGVWGALTRHRRARLEEQQIRQRALELLDYVGLAAQAPRLAQHLSYGDQRRLEIARALATEPLLLALDEPAAGMNPNERLALEQLLRRLRQDFQLTLLLIEHDVRLVMALCDRLAVLDYGKKIIEDTPQVVRHDARVIEAYLGAEE